ncbi:MAG TPA: hypothetical protein VNB59_07280 [Solirubrobacterales bacterium]|jgi:hypothetical protein|nr:hypothetical protein [Solirubrobacterales bacterium]
MAQTRKKRRRKRRGTQGGRVDPNPRRSRPRSREEAKAQARSRRKPAQKEDLPPTWRNSFVRGLFAAAIFGVLLIVLFKKPAAVSLIFAAFMLVFYVPAGYFIDMTMWRRRERARIRAREG